MALFSAKKEKAVVRRAGYKTGLLAATSLEEIEAQKARAQAGEESALEIYSRLGAPGTYEGPPTPSTSSPSDIYQTSGPLTEKSAAAQGLLSKSTRLNKDWQTGELSIDPKRSGKYGTGAETLFDPRTGILDPTKYANKVGESAQFRIQSRQTAEAEQLLRQEGPMWDMLNNSTIGRIYEGAAIQNREALRQIRNDLAKGGTARRTAFAQAQELMQIEKAHQARTQQTWTANLALHDYIRKNADRVQEGNIRFLDNLPELRSSYADTMKALGAMLTGQVVPSAMAGIQEQAKSEQAVAAKDGLFLEGLIMAGVSAVVGMATGIDLSGLASSLTATSANTTGGGGGGGGGGLAMGLLGAAFGGGSEGGGQGGGVVGNYFKNLGVKNDLNKSMMANPDIFGSAPKA